MLCLRMHSECRWRTAVIELGGFTACRLPHTMQTAAGSVVGRAIIAIARRQGVRTINLVRRKEQKQGLLDLGCASAPLDAYWGA